MTAAPVPGASAGYPVRAADRDRFVLARRGARPIRDSWRHQGVVVEPERAADGTVVEVATIFLTGRECPWRCVMCDLWRHTIAEDTPRGAIPAQIADAATRLRSRDTMPAHVKLYNAGSFFDRRAVPVEDDEAIVRALIPFSHVVVESHPALVGDRTWRLRDALARHGAGLEVAMGLETAHPGALAALNKRITVDDFARAAARLAGHGVALRVFLLIHPPFLPDADQHAWLLRSVAFAFACGASVVSLIPTRPGEGALQAIAEVGAFSAPRLADVERAAAAALAVARGRLLVDLWDVEALSACAACRAGRQARLHRLNLEQIAPPPVTCGACDEAGSA